VRSSPRADRVPAWDDPARPGFAANGVIGWEFLEAMKSFLKTYRVPKRDTRQWRAPYSFLEVGRNGGKDTNRTANLWQLGSKYCRIQNNQNNRGKDSRGQA
jgi:hypothetical protein